MEESILCLSDASETRGSADRSVVADRDRVAESLDAQSWCAICLDRAQLEAALADARWLRRRRNRLPVIALVDTADVERASELFACGVHEIVGRDASTAASLRPRVAGLVGPRAPARPLAAPGTIVARTHS